MFNSVETVVEALGGTGAVAALTGVSEPAVSNWKRRGFITPDKFLLIRDALKARGKEDVDPAVFGFKGINAEART